MDVLIGTSIACFTMYLSARLRHSDRRKLDYIFRNIGFGLSDKYPRHIRTDRFPSRTDYVYSVPYGLIPDAKLSEIVTKTLDKPAVVKFAGKLVISVYSRNLSRLVRYDWPSSKPHSVPLGIAFNGIITHDFDVIPHMTRRQLQITENLGGERNAQRILAEMEKDGFIASIWREAKVYFVNHAGRQRIASVKGDLSRERINHTLIRNNAYIELNMPKTWRNETPVRIRGKIELIADAVFWRDDNPIFIEADYRQTMRTNAGKIKKYARIFELLNGNPELIWATISKYRAQKLEEICDRYRLKNRIILFD